MSFKGRVSVRRETATAILIALAPTPRIVISKVAHVHHDATKMARYEAQVGNEHERFFSDPAHANAWLLFDP